MSEPELTPEEQDAIARQLADELRKLKVEDVLINTLMTVSSIGYRRLGLTADTRDERDLDQSRLAIETMRALTPVLERFVPAELARDFHQSVANLQLAYAKAASEAAGSAKAEAPSEAATSRGQAPGRGREGHEENRDAASESRNASSTAAEGDMSRDQVPEQGQEGQSDMSRDQVPEQGQEGQRGGDG